jgi:pimeloyl-ACP methyl ester carboxylesterase
MKFVFTFIALICSCCPLLLHAQSSSAVVESEYYTSPDGANIYYETIGNGKTVVLVHGFATSGSSWKKTALYKDLIFAGYQVVVMDLRGNGKSDKPHKAEFYENDVEAKDVMGILDKLGVKKYSVVGYSRGSIITSRLLVLDKRITRAVLGGMGLDFTNPDWPRRIMFYNALSGKPVKELESFVKFVQSSGLDQQALAFLQKSQPSTSAQELAEIKQPVLVISGTEDNDNGSAKDLAALIPKSTYASVPGDHGSTAGSAEFSAAVTKFLKH